ncbi:MAG: DALR domain-containing protein, partial [Methylobacter sp.]
FPHHENEIAQSEGATGEKFVNVWMHNGFVRVDDEKMSKSLGNFFTVREVLKKYRPEIIRFFILTSHYRSPLNYSDESLNDAKAGLDRFYIALRDALPNDKIPENFIVLDDYKVRFEQAMGDDFNTPEALAVLFGLANELNKAKKHKSENKIVLAATLKYLGGLLGILQNNPDGWLKGNVTLTVHNLLTATHVDAPELIVVGGVSEEIIDHQIQARLDAKKAKDWALADKIRNDLKEQGVILEDSPDGTTSWRRE